MYKKGAVRSQDPKAIQTDLRRCEVSGPPSFDTYARRASTTEDCYSVASVKPLATWSIEQRREARFIIRQPRQIPT